MKFSKKEEKNDIFYSSENRLTVRDEWRNVALGTDTNARASRRKQNVTRYVIDRVNGSLRANGEWCVSDCTKQRFVYTGQASPRANGKCY